MRRLLFTCLCSLSVFSNISGQDLKKEWLRILQSCGKSQIVGKETLFFGPSNTIGLGSVWRKTDKKGYNPRFEFSELIPDSTTRQKIIKLGEKSEQCTANKNNAWNSKVNLPFLGPIFELKGVGAELRMAKRATVTVDKIALDILKELPFEIAIKALVTEDPKNPFVNDLLMNPDRLLVTKAYRITGLTVKLDYDPKQLEELKGKYPEGGSINLGGENGLKVEFNYSSGKELTLKLPKEVYIAGELSRITPAGTINLNNPSDLKLQVTQVKVDPNGIIGTIEQAPTRKE